MNRCATLDRAVRLAAIALAAAPCLAQETEVGSDLTERFRVPDGLTVTLWAESPQLYNPTAIDVDSRGRLWVVEAVNYRKWGGRNPGRDHEAGDRVLILEDTDLDGACDSVKVFAQEEDLVAPLGIAVMGDRVVVSCSPDIYVYRDTDGDDVADEREVFLTGFGGFDHDHGVHSVVAAPDGGWLIAAGNAGPHIVTDRDGFELRSGSLYSGGGPTSADNKPGLLSSDGRLWTGGLILRVEPDGRGLEVLAHNFRNQYEVASDSFGNLFTEDNDDDGNAGCRTTWIQEGANYGFFSADGSRSWQADRRPGQDTQTAHWHQDDPGVAPAGTINGAGGPTGVAVYEAWDPEDEMWGLDGAVLNADAGAGVVYAHMPLRDGAGLRLQQGVFLGRTDDSGRASGDGQGAWFRPSDVVVAPSGDVFVADWYDPGVGGHQARDREAYGRILRVAAEDLEIWTPELSYELAVAPDPRPAEWDATVEPGLIGVLASPAVNPRAAALERLEELGDAAFDSLKELLGHASPRVAARALPPLARIEPRGRELVEQVLLQPNPDLRIAAFRALRRTGPLTREHIRHMVRDEDPACRAEVAPILRDIPFDECGDELLALATTYEGDDRFYLEALGIAADGKEAELYDALVDLVGNPFVQERFVEIAWRLHPRAAVPAFLARAMDGVVSVMKRRQAIDALAFVPEREAADAMITIALAGPSDLRAYAHWWLQHRSSNDWRAFNVLDAIGVAGFASLDAAEVLYSSGVTKGGLIDVDVDVSSSDTLWLVVEDGGNGNSCDWADWIEPRFVDASGAATRLVDLGWTEASAQWGSVNAGRNANGGPLRVGEEEFTDGIGTHARSVIAFQVPDDAVRFTSRAGPDHGGTSQGPQCSIEFKVLADREASREHLTQLRASIADASAPMTDRAEAARELAADPEGGLILLRMAERGELADGLRAAAAEAIFKNPDIGVRALASEHFVRPGAESASLPPISELAALDGDPRAGERVFFSEAAQCHTCHAVRGRGGDIGPELTEIRTKYGTAELLDSILNPSAGIVLGYESLLVETVDGVLYSGFVLADGDNLVLKDTQGRRHAIAADEIAGRYPQALSTMPEGVALDLDPQEIADLAAFLVDDPDAPPVYGTEIELFNGRDMTGWTHHLSDASANPEDVWSVVDGVIRCEGRPAGYIRTEAEYESYEITLEWRFDPARGPGNSGVLLRMVGADKVWPKSIEAQLHSRNAGDIWNIDRFPMQVDESRTRGRRTIKAQPTNEKPLGEWNRYRIVLDGGDLTIEVNGIVQNTATWVETVPGKICLQSEGAYIEFRNIRLRPILR